MLCVAPRLRRALALGLLTLAVPFSFSPAAAQPSALDDIALSLPQDDDLRPGQYRWFGDATAGEGPVRVVVSLPLQRAYVFRGSALIGVSTISSGRPGYDTPTGAFTILQKKVDHVSNLYDAPMPHMQRLTWDGIALHAGAIPGEPASHGCVRLPAAFARRLFSITELGTQVVVTDIAPAMPEEALEIASAS